MEASKGVSIGVDIKVFVSISSMYELNMSDYDYVMLPLVHPMQYRTQGIDETRVRYPLTYSGTFI
jgi:hypothetical protein